MFPGMIEVIAPLAEARLGGSSVTPGENSAQSENRRPFEREVIHGTLVKQSRERAGLGFNQGRRGGDRHILMRFSDRKSKFQFGLPPTSTCNWSVICGVMPGATARAEPCRRADLANPVIAMDEMIN